MRFSIIVPVYNVEKFIGKCMETLVCQSFSDYEIIVVDDESPDRSMEIVEDFARRYPGKITMLHQKNTRQGGARNNGVRHAKGEYLVFVDSDDYVSPRMLEIMDGHLRNTPCDILFCQRRPVTEDGKLLPRETAMEFAPGAYDPREKPEVVLLPVGPAHKAFRREFYVETGFAFPQGLLYEDTAMKLLYAQARSIVIREDVVYYYVQRGGSSMHQALSPRMLDILEVSRITRDTLEQKGLYETFREPMEVSLIYSILCVFDIINAVDFCSALEEPIAEYLKNNFPDYGNNPYVTGALRRNLDLITAGEFEKYSKLRKQYARRERLLENPLLQRLNQWRKAHF